MVGTTIYAELYMFLRKCNSYLIYDQSNVCDFIQYLYV